MEDTGILFPTLSPGDLSATVSLDSDAQHLSYRVAGNLYTLYYNLYHQHPLQQLHSAGIRNMSVSVGNRRCARLTYKFFKISSMIFDPDVNKKCSKIVPLMLHKKR